MPRKKKNAKKKKPLGRPSWIPTEEQQRQVEELAGLGLRDNDIALIIGVSERTIKNKCRELLDSGRAKALEKVSRTAHQMAASGKWPVMTIFYLKVRGGWRESSDLRLAVAELPNITFGTYGTPGFEEIENNGEVRQAADGESSE